ncbi:MAG: phenylalanine--tRNA ligase subunit beta [Flavobacteriaceae bacterium]|nr:phenylalanine--tRNA ligase subunit beta [Flavobacteriaceae bacterium]
MKISYNWLKQFLKTDWEATKTGDLLTDLGLEIEGIEEYESVKGSLKGIVVGEVLSCVQHPNADRLKVTTVDLGNDEEPVQIVCGAPNVDTGQKVAVATIGTVLYDEKGESFKIKKGKIRGEVSFGMICAEDELGLGKGHDGIMVLDNDLKPGTKVSEIFDIEIDEIFEIGLTPNRADAMSHFGVARDLRVGMIQQGESLEMISPSVSMFGIEDRTSKIEIEIENSALTPRFAGLVLSGVDVKESPKWMQNRLKSIGLKPINNVVDASNYVLHELGQPIHVYDLNSIKGGKISVKNLATGTKFTTLDGVKIELHNEDIVICNGNNEPMSIAGVMGGLNSSVSENTNSIFIECAYFDAVSIRKTAKRHSLNTDASFRFERGIDINITKYVLKRVTLLIQEMAGGKVTSEITDIYPKKIEDFEIFISYEKVYRLIGQDIPKDTIKNILASLEIKLSSETEGGLGLVVPSYRVDVQREADIIEEILRVYGYNNIALSKKLNSSLSFDDSKKYKVESVISKHLVSVGFYETMANSLTKDAYNELTKSFDRESQVEILNPLSKDLNIMRQTLLFGGLEAVAYNINRKNSSLKLFEFGKTYHKYNDKYQEDKHLSVFVTGKRNADSWAVTNRKSDFFFLKGIINSIFDKVGLSKIKTKPLNNDLYSEGLEFYCNKKKIALLGIVNPSLAKKLGIKQEVLSADINWDVLLDSINFDNIKVKALAKYPSVKRDLALVLDSSASFEEIYNIAFQTERKFLKNVDLFDVYQGDKLPEGKKSYAISFLLQDENKTLEDKQIDKVMQKLLQGFEKNIGATLR